MGHAFCSQQLLQCPLEMGNRFHTYGSGPIKTMVNNIRSGSQIQLLRPSLIVPNRQMVSTAVATSIHNPKNSTDRSNNL